MVEMEDLVGIMETSQAGEQRTRSSEVGVKAQYQSNVTWIHILG